MLLVVSWLLLFNESIMYWHTCYATIYENVLIIISKNTMTYNTSVILLWKLK